MARKARTATRLAAGVGIMLAAMAGSISVAQASAPVRPGIQPPLRVQARVTVPPRAVSAAALSQAEMVPPDTLQAIANLALQPFTFEAEDWGDRPDLGFSVQDMSGWGSQWSGNKQIFWNPQPPGSSFKWDFSAPGGAMLRIYLTAAPDYGNMSIRLGCYQKVSENYYQLRSQHLLSYEGHASSVSRRMVAYPLAIDPKCKTADMFRLLFTSQPMSGRVLGGIDSIVVSK
jgi:hypothetical protein